jgi:hypothetical protein
MEWLLELILVLMLAATLFHAIRLERALGVLKRDRAALQDLVASFNASTTAAEQGIARLRQATEGAGRGLSRQIELIQSRQDDLTFLIERAEREADRLEVLVRGGRSLAQEATPPDPAPATPLAFRPRSQAEQDLMKALRMAR